MSWKVHDTDDVFAALRGLCSNGYRMYDPSEYRYYYDHDCETYECAVEDAAREYERLAEHCANQREQLAKLNGSQTIDILMELLNEYQESGCAIEEDRVTYYADRIDGRTEDKRMDERTKTEQNGVGSSKVRAGSSITDELRSWGKGKFADGLFNDVYEELLQIADRIDEQVSKMYADLTIGMEPMDEEHMARDGWVKLPVDADGVPIHIGDELTNGKDMPAKVRSMMLIEEGWMVSSQPRPGLTVAPEILRHHQPDSWERIIEDAISESGWEQPKDYEIDYEDSKETRDRFVAELVERCRRLAGDGK